MSAINRIRSAIKSIENKLEGHRSGDPQLELDGETIDTLKADLEVLRNDEAEWVDRAIDKAKEERIYGSR
jgi:demethoxyubiquinone hydroxylase (CLK1/Coq7/Cat5 family)